MAGSGAAQRTQEGGPGTKAVRMRGVGSVGHFEAVFLCHCRLRRAGWHVRRWGCHSDLAAESYARRMLPRECSSPSLNSTAICSPCVMPAVMHIFGSPTHYIFSNPLPPPSNPAAAYIILEAGPSEQAASPAPMVMHQKPVLPMSAR